MVFSQNETRILLYFNFSEALCQILWYFLERMKIHGFSNFPRTPYLPTKELLHGALLRIRVFPAFEPTRGQFVQFSIFSSLKSEEPCFDSIQTVQQAHLNGGQPVVIRCLAELQSLQRMPRFTLFLFSAFSLGCDSRWPRIHTICALGFTEKCLSQLRGPQTHQIGRPALFCIHFICAGQGIPDFYHYSILFILNAF